MDTIGGRLALRRQVLAFLSRSPREPDNCFNNGQFRGTSIVRRIGDGDESESMVASTATSGNITFAVKLTPGTVNPVENETLGLCEGLLARNMCPNLSLVFSTGECNNCPFTRHIDGHLHTGGKCGVVVNEYAELGDMRHWVSSQKRTAVEMNVALFQICAGIYALFKHCGVSHNDLHLGNVLVHRTTVGGYWKYVIDGKEYLCPNLGFMCVLWDFGYASRTEKCTDHVKVARLLATAKLQKSVEDMLDRITHLTISDVFGELKLGPRKGKIIETYTL